MGLKFEDLVEDITRIGVGRGDCLALGVSLRSLGWVDGGPDTLIDALLECVGEEGTLLIPAFTRSFRLPIPRTARGSMIRPGWGGMVPWDYVFDPDTTPPETGAVPAAMWRREGSVRSRHPVFSVVAMGRLAEFLVRGHDENAPGFLPYSRLAERGGRGLFIGLEGRLVSLRHLGQVEAGLMKILPPLRGVRYRRSDGSIGIYEREEWACVIRLPELNPGMVQEGLIVEGIIGKAPSMLVDGAGVVQSIARSLREDPSLNLCRRYHCLWCRELERRYNLYDRIPDPSIFQRSGVIRAITHKLNDMRMRRSIWATRLTNLLSVLISLAEGKGTEEE